MEVKSLNELVRGTPQLSLKVPLSYTLILKETVGKPMIIRQALGLKHTLEKLPIIIRPDELIVGTFDDIIPVAIPRMEGSGFRIMKELENLPHRIVNPINVKKKDIKTLREEIAPKSVFETAFSGCAFVATEIGGIAHIVADYPRLIFLGLKKYINLSQEKLANYKPGIIGDTKDNEKVAFYKAMIIICKALISYAHRYSEHAKLLFDSVDNKER